MKNDRMVRGCTCKLEYHDGDIDAAYIYVASKRDVSQTVESKMSMVLLDYNADGEVVGVEVIF